MSTFKCPRCGAEMKNGVCDNCGFPIVGGGRAKSFGSAKQPVRSTNAKSAAWKLQYR